MAEEPLFATPDDFKNKFGLDLREILRGSDNDSNYPFIFMRLVQDFLLDWCDESGFRRLKTYRFTPFQRECFKNAILYQTYFAWKNGSMALGLDSGVDGDRGVILDEASLKRAEVPSRVIILLHKAGLFNLKIKNRPRFSRGYPGMGPFYEDF